MNDNRLQKIKTSWNKGVTTISLKTSLALEKAKINTHIDSVQKEIDSLYFEVGNLSYKIWQDNLNDFSVLNDYFNSISAKLKEQEILRQEIAKIEDQSNRILGENLISDNNTDKFEFTDKRVCPNCGIEINANANFCRKCGYKLKE